MVIDWTKAQKKINNARWMYDNVPAIKEGVDRDCSISVGPDPPPPSPPLPPEPVDPTKTKLLDFIKPCSSRELRGTPAVVSGIDEPWIYAGNGHYRFMYPKQLEILRLIFRLADRKFPRPGNEKAVWGDAGGAAGGDHEYHTGYNKFDLNYFTLSTPESEGHNITHYRHDYMPEIEIIWHDKPFNVFGYKRYRNLIEEKFDAEKNHIILRTIEGVFIRSVIRVGNGLVPHLKAQGPCSLVGDDYAFHNHWRHAHIKLGPLVNWYYDFSEILLLAKTTL